MIIVIGLGITGLSAAQYFAKKGVPVRVVDTRDNPPNLLELKKQYPDIPVYTGGITTEAMEGVTEIVLSPGLAKDHPDLKPYVDAGVPVVGDVEIFARAVNVPVIAITGSNGKSTVTSLLGEMAKASGVRVGVGGNLGIPVLSMLDHAFDDASTTVNASKQSIDKPSASPFELYVLELSSFQLELIDSLAPEIATVLNICPDHMDRYASLEAYYGAKHRIFNQCKKIVVNRDDEWVMARIPKRDSMISFGLEPPLNLPADMPFLANYGLEDDHLVKYESVASRGNHAKPGLKSIRKQILLPVSELKLFGHHNIKNALAALALGDLAGFPLEAMLSTLRTFKGLEHRCERVRTREGVIWINDSKGTNVGATLAALEGVANAISGKWILLAGGLSKNADFSPLKPVIKEHCSHVILFGEAAPELHELLSDAVPCFRVTDMKEAVMLASQKAQPNDGVLLSPACASMDMFRNFEERGQVFKSLVDDLSP